MFTEAIQTFDLIDFIRLIASSIFLTERIQENSLLFDLCYFIFKRLSTCGNKFAKVLQLKRSTHCI